MKEPDAHEQHQHGTLNFTEMLASAATVLTMVRKEGFTAFTFDATIVLCHQIICV